MLCLFSTEHDGIGAPSELGVDFGGTSLFSISFFDRRIVGDRFELLRNPVGE